MTGNIEHPDGRVEAFDPEKIVSDCIQAGISEKVAKEVAEEVSRKMSNNAPAHILRKWIEAALEGRNRESAALYRHFEQTKSRPVEKKAYRHRQKHGYRKQARK